MSEEDLPVRRVPRTVDAAAPLGLHPAATMDFITDESAQLGRAYHEWRRHERNLERLEELTAPDLLIRGEQRLRDSSLVALRALGWEHGPVRVHHTPYDLDRAHSPTASQVARRALVLAAIAERALLEADGDLEFLAALRDWARCLEEELEPQERAALMGPLGMLSPAQLRQSSWLVEGAAAMAWALGLGEALPHDQRCHPRIVNEILGLQLPESPEPEDQLRLRSRSELVAEYERLWAVHWRLVDFRTRSSAMNFPELGKTAPFWFGPLATAGVATAGAAASGTTDVASCEVLDMAIGGQAISLASERQRHECESIVVERRHALGWVCGLATRYSDVPMET